MSRDVFSEPKLEEGRDGRPACSPEIRERSHDGRAGGPSLPSASEVRRNNTLFGTHRELGFVWAGKPAHLRFVDSTLAPRATGWLRTRIGDHSFDLGLPALPEPASLGVEFAGIEVAALPEALLLGVLEAWLAEPIAQLQRHNVPFTFEDWQTNEGPIDVGCGWEVSWTEQKHFLRGSLHASPEALGFLADLVHRMPPTPGRPADSVPFPVSVALARIPLAVATLRSIAAGDVLLLPIPKNHWSQGNCELWTGERRLAQAIRQGRVVKISTMNSSSEVKAPTAASDTLRVDELPVQVVFDVGQLDLTVGQLRTLAAGYTFELPAFSDRLVAIRANGREIGQGELVDVGEKLGVRIVNWSLA